MEKTLMNSEERDLSGISLAAAGNAPGFDKNNRPDMADPTWAAGIHAYYRTTPGQTPAIL